MRLIYKLLISTLCASALTVSCINPDYDFENLKDVNTDISFGGEYFGLPIGNISPIKLGEFLTASDMISIVDGKYEFKYANYFETEVGSIDPINISVDIPQIDPVLINIADVSIGDIQMPTINIATTKDFTLPAAIPGIPSFQLPEIDLNFDGSTNINIIYEYTDEIKHVNSIMFGAEGTTTGDLFTLSITPALENVLQSSTVKIKNFAISFPTGFELGLIANDPYHGTLSNGGATYTITNQTLSPTTPIKLYLKKLTFNPSQDQSNGLLEYRHAISFDATFGISGTTKPNISSSNISISTAAQQKINLASGDFDTNAITSSTLPSETIDIAINQDLGSDIIKSLSLINFAEPATLTVNIAESGLPAQISGINLNNYKIAFPSFIEFEDAEINRTKTLTINESITNTTGLTKKIKIKGFKFNQNPVQPDGTINVSDKLLISGDGITIPASNNINSSDIGNITLTPTISLSSMQIGIVKGVIKPEINIEPQIIDFSLDNNMSFLYDSKLDLDRIALKFNIDNTTEIGANIGVELTPYDETGNPISENIMSQQKGIEILPSQKTKLWLSNSSIGMPEGYTFIENAQIKKILHKIPYKIKTDVKVELAGNDISVDLSQQTPMKIKLTYEIVAPLSLGKDFKLVYEQKIENIGDQIEAYADYISGITLELNAISSIPLDLNIAAQAFDSNGSSVGVSITTDGAISAGGKDGITTKSNIKLIIKETSKGELKKLDQVKLILIGSCNEEFAGTNLEESQSIELSGKLIIPGGLNLNDLNNTSGSNGGNNINNNESAEGYSHKNANNKIK